MPSVFVSHGGGPMPVMGRQPDIVKDMKSIVAKLPRKPTTILVVTAHWETNKQNTFEVSSGETHPLLFDYGGFPPETYKYQYNANGNPALAH